MSRSGQAYIAATRGTQFTLYAVCRALGIPLSKEQEDLQEFLESVYPPVVEEGTVVEWKDRQGEYPYEYEG